MKIPRAARCQTPISVTWMLNLTSGQASIYQLNTGKPKRPLENQDVDADDDYLDMPDFFCHDCRFQGPKKGYDWVQGSTNH